MKLPGYRILREVTKKREITLGDAKKLLPTKYRDKRDFFALASLYTSGLVDSSFVKEGCNWDTDKNSMVAEEFYVMSLGPGEHHVEGIPSFTNEDDYNKSFKIYCTAKGDLFFHELREKRKDRLLGLLIGAIIAVLSAAATNYLRAYFSN